MSAHIGVTGLAVMGANLARNLARNGFTVALHNRSVEKTDTLLAKYGDEGDFVRTETLQELVDSLEKPRRVLIMVKAGKPVDAVIEQLLPLLEAGDIIIDAGNSHFSDTQPPRGRAAPRRTCTSSASASPAARRARATAPRSWSAVPRSPTTRVGPILEAIAAHVDGEPCCAWIGPDGAGHFVKTIHNGIEYADMQMIAEIYRPHARRRSGSNPAEHGRRLRGVEQGRRSTPT